MTDIRTRVIFCPHKDFADVMPPPDSWPVAPEVTVRLTREGKKATGGKTGIDGYTRPFAADADTYQVKITGAPPLWIPAREYLEVTDEADQIHTVLLVPEGDRQLVPLELSSDEPGKGPVPLSGVTVTVVEDDDTRHSFVSDAHGRVLAVAPLGRVTLELPAGKGGLMPPSNVVTVPVRKTEDLTPRTIEYAPEILVAVEPVLSQPDGTTAPLVGAAVTLYFNGSPLQTENLKKGDTEVTFRSRAQGYYRARVVPPPGPSGGALTEVAPPQSDVYLQPGDPKETVTVTFESEQTEIKGRVQTEDGKPLTKDVQLQISGDGVSVRVKATRGQFSGFVPAGVPLTITVVPGQKLDVTGVPLAREAAGQPVLFAPDETVVWVPYEHAIKGRAVDEQGNPVPGAMIDIFDEGQTKLATVVTAGDGRFTHGVAAPGSYYVAQHPPQGLVDILDRVEVHSNGDVGDYPVRTLAERDAEAFTDLAAYPVLTEEISTTGVPAPAPGGLGTGGADYGPVVDQAMRDVLGWRPGGDVAGFQAALTGAFQLRDAAGHTEWTWQQRGYAVQADMGALTGAQASIYARAKSALDQILPLLASLTPLNPALYPPQDLEAIRTVITTELQELVTELALPGGPRIQRVDQLFHLLTGDDAGSKNLSPDVVQGNLGTLRDRFGLTVDEIDTVEEERIVTNFRIVVEQVLSLQATWSTDRGLLAPLDPRASLGTVLIWLSRSLEAVCESVGDLTFALDSVFVDAAQRQVIELKFPGEEALLLSDLLDWVERASRDEGPRIIQDAGKDGVFAFAPVLRRLRDLIGKTRAAARKGQGLPDGMRTPRVDRALQVLVTQLNEATELASSVRRDTPPVISPQQVIRDPQTLKLVSLPNLTGRPASIRVEVLGANFRTNASVVLIAQNREDLPELHAWSIKVTPPSLITATFRNPMTVPDSAGVTWLVAVTNEDGTQSQFPI